MTLIIEDMREGWLVRGTDQPDEALAAVKARDPERDLDGCTTRPGRYRKVPGQWSDWVLYDGIGPGSFIATTVTLPPTAGPRRVCQIPDCGCTGEAHP